MLLLAVWLRDIMNRPGAICMLPKLTGLGGPASFQSRLAAGLQARGVRIARDLAEPGIAALLVVGGVSRLDLLLRAHRRGIRVVQRLNGMNWIHRRRFTGLGHFVRSEWNNFILALIRRSMAGHIIYQSQFSHDWWRSVYREIRVPSTVIYNGVDLAFFSPAGTEQTPVDRYQVLLVEGRLGGGNELGLENAVQLVCRLNELLDRRVELKVVGSVPDKLASAYDQRFPGLVTWQGIVHRDQIPPIDRAAHVLFSADINAACPNSVIEALACGLPVVAFATGALPEMIRDNAGAVVPWGGDHWRLDPPDIASLAGAAAAIIRAQQVHRPAARARAQAAFGLDAMVERYLDVLLG